MNWQEQLNSNCKCRTCRHFLHQKRGKRGGLKGICEFSKTDTFYYAQNGHLRAAGCRKACKLYEEAENVDV